MSSSAAKNKLPPLAPPVVGPDTILPEFTVKGLILGFVLSMVLGAANTYLGLRVGLTVSASIPAAVVSMTVFRAFRRTNILENNAVQTAASSGESLAAGMIFTIPAVVMMGAWDSYRYWPTVIIGLTGGLLGVIFTIPLRRILIEDLRLQFPEGLATAEVLKTGGIEYDAGHPDKDTRGGESSSNFKRLVQAAGLGAAFKIAESVLGWVAGAADVTRAWLGGRWLFTADITLSPALLGVGFIVGLNIAVLVFIGAFIGTTLGVPLNFLFSGDALLAKVGIPVGTALADISQAQWGDLAGASWQDCRRIGVGAMLVGGFWSLITLIKPLAASIRASIGAYRAALSGKGTILPRTQQDIPLPILGMILLASLPVLFFTFATALGPYPGKYLIALVLTVLVLFFGFIFTAVAGYIAGLVGSSNNPISGVTVSTVVVTSIIILGLMGNTGPAATLGPLVVIFLAAFICSAAAMAGDNTQDLKSGHILGATPWRQQVYQFVGVTGGALVVPLVLAVLDKGYGVGRIVHADVAPLAAPQATLMRDITGGIFGASLNWNYILIGMALAVVLIILDEVQRARNASFRFPVLAVAVGIYLPFGLSVPIVIGGIMAEVLRRRALKYSPEKQSTQENAGLLLASGLITGESLMGVFIAVGAVIFGKLATPASFAPITGILAMAGLAVFLFRSTARSVK
ncbi:MAG: oligopeptide transporter, OPT family [Verrucomicrobiota bacterium]|nr:oligopeptide transporter, OPT family [Verrucomicrobiota bacterium]